MRRALQNEAPILAVGVVVWGFYLSLILPYLPNAEGHWAPDYYLHFPNLLVGLAWERANGLFVAPWFNPSQCGGVPYFADPNVAYYSLPQALRFFHADRFGDPRDRRRIRRSRPDRRLRVHARARSPPHASRRSSQRRCFSSTAFTRRA